MFVALVTNFSMYLFLLESEKKAQMLLKSLAFLAFPTD